MQNPPVQELLTRREGLATRLKHARGAMLAKQLAERAGWPQSKVSKIETGKQLPSRDDLDLWAALTETNAAGLDTWHGMLTEAEQARRDWVTRMRDGGQEAVQKDFSDLVRDAGRLSFFETTVMPRFFQIPGYSRSVLTWVNEELGRDDDVEAAVAVRQGDVGFLYAPDKTFDMLITEPVLYWRHHSMPAAVMRQQLDRLLTLDGLPNVTFGIVPMAAPVTALPIHSFEIYGDTLALETLHSFTMITDEEEIAGYRKTLERLWATAVTGDGAARLIHRALDALPRT
jgi:transcriptional regulator with XRE-family HTH domain